jgi:hypothetical protein
MITFGPGFQIVQDLRYGKIPDLSDIVAYDTIGWSEETVTTRLHLLALAARSPNAAWRRTPLACLAAYLTSPAGHEALIARCATEAGIFKTHDVITRARSLVTVARLGWYPHDAEAIADILWCGIPSPTIAWIEAAIETHAPVAPTSEELLAAHAERVGRDV